MDEEMDYVYEDDRDDTEYHEPPEEACSCANGCMDCLGISWRDFL